MVRRASCDLQRAAGIRVAREVAPLRCLSLGRWRNTRARRARAPCRAGCDCHTCHGRALHRREASLLRCKTVVRRASCGLQHAAGFRVARAKRATALALSREVATHASLPRARAVPRCCVGPPPYERALHRREASLLRCKTVVRRASCDLQHTAGFRVARRARHCAGCLSGGGKTRELAARARRAALAVIGPRPTEGHCTGGRPLSSAQDRGATLRAVTSNRQPAFAWYARKRHCAGCLSGGGKTRELAARAPRCAGCGRPMRHGRTLHRREVSLLRCKNIVRPASCDLQRTAGFHIPDVQTPLHWL